MEPLTRQGLHGTWAAVLLPVDDDNAIDLGRLDAELEVLVGSPVDGVYTNGTAGEFHAIGEDEFDALTALVASRCTAAGKPFQLGASHMSGDTSLGRVRRALRFEPSGIQVILPDWCPLNDDEVIAAVEGLAAAAAPLPITLYNPPNAKTCVTPRLYGVLVERVPQLIGIKVAGGDAAWFTQMHEHAPGLAVFVAGHRLASGVELGAAGAYSNVACLSPAGAAAWYETMTTDPGHAAELEQRINAFLEVHIISLRREGYCDAALDKTLAAIGDWAPIGTRTRWPFGFVDPARIPALREVAREQLPELLSA